MWFCLHEYIQGRKRREEREGCWDSPFAFKTCEFHPLPSWALIKTGAPV